MKVKSESEVARSCLTLSDLMDCSLPGSSVHGIFQARVLEWGAIAFSDVSSISVIYSTYSFLSTQRRSFQPVCYIGATTFMVASGDLQNTQESVGLQPARSVNTQGQNCRWMSIHISTHSQDWMVQTAPSKPHLVVLPRVRAEPQINSAFPESHQGSEADKSDQIKPPSCIVSRKNYRFCAEFF